ncbi:hypothetical protein [Yoonia sp. BS5-3]|uniref:Uncharacterized protein n=1 Tax=Yoonia phaeophyticola TaxID=3137369 RepID=A0ABZ2V9Q1_9RHOB
MRDQGSRTTIPTAAPVFMSILVIKSLSTYAIAAFMTLRQHRGQPVTVRISDQHFGDIYAEKSIISILPFN